ncbi:hypothetical protein B5F14_08290 [Faecalitalea cylindroides]|uniref:D-glucuronyl C5-epimerase C-terminal domain-containing protein n=1 Tax=Faecalitalea cylindroides TaxID=39483 RepID=A0A1Y4LMY6_9FIRM|nr:D-glucuronyl C5-epimerase family protein [Faecalitalea cylindroides]OUP58046.1 hypothetical protein B5F14_08290 [Faecalitalea cylindroides]
MGLSIYNIKKWIKMFTGNSVLHVDQSLGEVFTPSKLEGYFNNLTKKVEMQPQYLENDCLPTVKTEKGEDILFPVAIFQYGLGCWDLYLIKKDEKYKIKFLQCAEWAIENQDSQGAWNNFFFAYPDHPYGAMAQGEGASLLTRAWQITKKEEFLKAAKRAIHFMLQPVEKGGTSKYIDEDLILLEYTHLPAVLNGWIFSVFGLYDICLVCEDEKFKTSLNKTLKTLENYMSFFDCDYWSNYDLNNHITSPFYHHLHIAQMKALYLITEKEVFLRYEKKWTKEERKKSNKIRAIIHKSIQKIKE